GGLCFVTLITNCLLYTSRCV
ncbi:hypothetical protein AZZ73_003739, partial [Klebsiella pneumoniae]